MIITIIAKFIRPRSWNWQFNWICFDDYRIVAYVFVHVCLLLRNHKLSSVASPHRRHHTLIRVQWTVVNLLYLLICLRELRIVRIPIYQYQTIDIWVYLKTYINDYKIRPYHHGTTELCVNNTINAFDSNLIHTWYVRSGP